MATWTTIAKAADIPAGKRQVIELGRWWIAVFNVNGQYYAIEDICTHDDGPLSDGTLTGTTIECPRHGACFDITNGRVLSAPALVSVPSYPVRIENGNIQVEL